MTSPAFFTGTIFCTILTIFAFIYAGAFRMRQAAFFANTFTLFFRLSTLAAYQKILFWDETCISDQIVVMNQRGACRFIGACKALDVLNVIDIDQSATDDIK